MASAAIGNPRPAQVAAFFDRSGHTSPGRRPRSIHGNVTFPASTRRRSKTRRDPFAASQPPNLDGQRNILLLRASRQSRAERQGVDANAVGVYERVARDIKGVDAACERFEGQRDILGSQRSCLGPAESLP
jgi:hypothetical protein